MSANERLGIDLIITPAVLPNDPFAALTTAVSALQDKLAKLDWSKITKGLDEVNKKADALGKAGKETQDAVDKQVNSIAKRMEAVLGVSATTIKDKLKEAFQFEGVEQGASKLSKLKDMMIEVNGQVLAMSNKKGIGDIFKANPDAEFSIFSKKKLEADVNRFKQELVKLKDFADKNGQFNVSALAGLQNKTNKFFEGDLKSSKDLDVLKVKALELQGILDRGVKFKGLDEQVDKLSRSFSTLQGSTAFDKLKSLSSANFNDDLQGIAKYGREIAKVRVELENLDKSQKNIRTVGVQQGQASDINDKLKVQYAGYANKDADGAYQAYLANIRKQQEEHGKQLLAIIKNTNAAEKAEQDKAIQEWKQYLSAINNSGQKYYNGSVVPKSYVTDSGNAQVMALKEAAARAAAQVTTQGNPWQDLLKGIGSQGFKMVGTDIVPKSYVDSIADAYAAAMKEAKDRAKGKIEAQGNPWIELLSGLNKQGFKMVGTDIVPKSYVEDVAKAFALASKQNAQVSGSGGNIFQASLSALPPLSSSIADINRSLGLTATQIKALNPQQLRDLRTALAPFKVTIDETTGALKKMGAETNGVKSVLGHMFARLVEFYSIRTVLFAVGAQFRDATKSALDFNQNIHDILAISGESKDRFDAIASSIREIAKSSRFTSNEVAQLMQVLAQAGVKADELPAVSQQVGIFATATKTDPKLAGDLFTTAQNNYDIKAINATRITNALTAALNESKLEASGLGTAFNYLAPQTAQLGISMEKTLAMIATQAQAGVKPSTIGTGMSQMLKEFAAPKARLKSLLEYYGIKAEDIDPLKNDFPAIVDTLNNALGKAGEKGVQVSHMFAALESRVGRSTVASLKLGGDAFREMESKITGTSAAMIAYDKSMEGAHARMNVVKQMFQEFIANALAPMAPAFIAATESLQGWLTGLNAINPSALAAVTGLVAITAAIGGLISTVSILKTVAGTATVGGGIASLLGITATTAIGPILAVVAAISVLVGGIAAVGYGLNKQKREQEEVTKAELAAIEVKQKYANVMESIGRTTERQHPELKKYAEAVALYGEKSAEATALGNKKLVMTAQQRVELSKLILQSPALQNTILSENELYSEQYNIMRMLNAEKFTNASNAAKEYNSRVAEISSKISAAAAERDRLAVAAKQNPKGMAHAETDLSGNVDRIVSNSDAYKDKIKEVDTLKKSLTDASLIAAQQKAVGFADSTLVSVGKGKTKTQTEAWVPDIKVVDGSPVPLLKHEKKIADDAAVVGDWSPSGKKSGAGAGNSQDYKAAATRVALLKSHLEELKAEIKDIPASLEDIQKKALAADAILKELEAAEIAQATESIEKDYKENGKWKKGVDSAKAEQELKERIEYAKSKARRATHAEQEALKSAVEEKQKVGEFYSKEISKHEAEAIKKQEDAWQKNFEETLKNKSATTKDLLAAYGAELDSIHKEYEAKRVEVQVEEEAKLEEKLKAAKIKKGSKEDKAARLQSFENTSARLDGVNADQLKATMQAQSLMSNAGSPAIIAAEKAADIELRTLQASLAIKKELAWTGAELNNLEVQGINASIEAQEKKNTVYTTFRDNQAAIKQDIIASINENKDGLYKSEADKLLAINSYTNKHAEALEEVNDKLRAGVQLIEQQRIKAAQQADTSFLGNFTQGVQEAWKKLDDFKGQTKQLGSSITDTVTGGLTSTLSNTFTTAFNPDQQKIAELNKNIADLKVQKTELEASISAIDANTSKTPEEIKTLNDKKVALDEVNDSLKAQEAAVRKQKDAWSTFSEGLKGIMKSILEKLQTYIAELLVVWAVQKMVGIFTGPTTSPSASTGGTPMSPLQVAQSKADGGLIQHFADGALVKSLKDIGGHVPTNIGTPGQDSVPTVLMPGEVVIRKSMVDYYGKDFLLSLNAGKIEKLANGGVVGGGGASLSNGKDQKEYNLQIVNIAQGDQIPDPGQQATQILNVINSDIAKRGATYRSVKFAATN